ncbi:MAG: aminoacyl-tRNA hydrolase [Xanthomonadales bacterium]|jgi:PTH1 family peptidyl-tRNA hydrolase|nr:aminoacyl-tRNA hydrolase [Xanthomonadales bacterium]
MAIALIAGLGNPGSEYARTRHNAGFWFLDALAEATGASLRAESKLHAEAAKAVIGGQSVWLLKPSTFMNRSGQAVQAALAYYKLAPADCLVVHDDLDLAAGVARLKFDGGHGGQNGLRDLIQRLGHARFHRLRIGIGHPGHKDQVTPWVLGRPGAADEQAIRASIDAALAVLPELLAGRVDAAMQRLHSGGTPGPAQTPPRPR